MAGAGYKLFNTGDVLTAAQVNTYLQEQVVMVFANAAARTTALSGVLAEGMVSYLKDTDALEIYSGAAWVGYGSGDITGITTGATSGLTGGVTSGTADLKLNTTAKGGLLVGTGSGTASELTVGANNTILTADSSTATGLKWAAASSGALTFITSSTFSNQASVTIDNCFTSTYATYLVILESMSAATGGDDLQLQMRYGSTTLTASYFGSYVYQLTNSATFSGGGFGFRSASQITLSPDVGSANTNGGGMFYVNPVGTGSANRASLWGQYANNNTETGVSFGSTIDSAENYTGFLLKSSSTNITGTVRVYGLAKS